MSIKHVSSATKPQKMVRSAARYVVRICQFNSRCSYINKRQELHVYKSNCLRNEKASLGTLFEEIDGHYTFLFLMLRSNDPPREVGIRSSSSVRPNVWCRYW